MNRLNHFLIHIYNKKKNVKGMKIKSKSKKKREKKEKVHCFEKKKIITIPNRRRAEFYRILQNLTEFIFKVNRRGAEFDRILQNFIRCYRNVWNACAFLASY